MKTGLLFVSALMLISATCMALANDKDSRMADIADASKIRVGFYTSQLDTDLRLDPSGGGNGTDLDFESDLGFADDTNQYWLNLNWRLSESNYIDVSYVKIDRSSSRQIDTEIEFGDAVFQINSLVEAFFDTDYLSISYRRVFTRTDRSEFGASLGIGTLWLSTGIEATGGPSIGQQQNASVTAPFPVLGVHGYRQLSPNLYLTGSAEYFTASISGIDGTVTDFRVGLDYYFSRQFGVGVRYDYNLLKASVDRSSFHGETRYQFGGLQYYAIYVF